MTHYSKKVLPGEDDYIFYVIDSYVNVSRHCVVVVVL